MDKELKNRILKTLFEKQRECDLQEITTLMLNYEKNQTEVWTSFRDKIYYKLIILKDFDLVNERIDLKDSRNPIYYYRISANGSKKFDPWFQKFWEFFTNDMGKILSIIATILSIIAIILSF